MGNFVNRGAAARTHARATLSVAHFDAQFPAVGIVSARQVSPLFLHGGRDIPAIRAVMWRGFDVIVAVIILVTIFPFLIFLSLFIFVSDPGPILFRHRRLGRRGRYFDCLKFRTMKINGDEILREYLRSNPEALKEWMATQKLRCDPRVTAVGAVIRKLSLDEFPQLINVLRGDMSIVGPRPIVEMEVDRYGEYFEKYCLVRPGLTGLWQTSGRSDTSYDERVGMDVRYVDQKSVLLDIMLLCKTVPAVLFARGSY